MEHITIVITKEERTEERKNRQFKRGRDINFKRDIKVIGDPSNRGVGGRACIKDGERWDIVYVWVRIKMHFPNNIGVCIEVVIINVMGVGSILVHDERRDNVRSVKTRI